MIIKDTMLKTLEFKNRPTLKLTWFICFILSVAVFLPIEFHLGGVFLRPILLATLVLWLILGVLSLLRKEKIFIYSLDKNYLYYMLLLGLFFLVQSTFLNRSFVGIKEVIEIFGSMALMLLLRKIRIELGLLRTLHIMKNIAYIASILWVSSKFIDGNFATFKDPYWILLISTLLSLIFIKLKGGKLDYFMLFILMILGVLSASRTLWVTVLLFVFIIFDLRKIVVPMLVVIIMLVLASSLNPQYSYYFNGLHFLANNYMEVINNVGNINGNLDNKSDSVRIIEALRSISVFSNHPIFGVGIDNYQDYINQSPNYNVTTNLTAHNEFLRVLAEGGVVLFLCYTLLYRSIWKGFSTISNGDLRLIAKALLLASLALAFFTATNYTIHFILQLSLLFIPYYSNGINSYVNGGKFT
jgi:hypothetical protein